MTYNYLGIFGYLLILAIVSMIAWLFHREILTSRKSGGSGEKSLEEERNSLEQRVAERTEALIKLEHERTDHLGSMARFGELSQGLFHDLMSPLSSLSLYLERLESTGKDSDETKINMEKIVGISKRMNTFMDSVKRSLGKSDAESRFETSVLKNEVNMVRDVLAYKARTAGVRIITDCSDYIVIPVNPVRLHQLLQNLVSNGIDACVEKSKDDKFVKISSEKIPDGFRIQVSDNGTGIEKSRLETLFTDPVSTKSGGPGIGLTTVKSIVDHELHGKISVESEVGKGTTFTITV